MKETLPKRYQSAELVTGPGLVCSMPGTLPALQKGERYIIAFDFETSDLPVNGGEPIEFAAVIVEPRSLRPTCHFFRAYFKLPDGVQMDPEAERINGCSTELVNERGTSTYHALKAFWGWLEMLGLETPVTHGRDFKKGQLVGMGQNIHFDLYFLKKWLHAENVERLLHFKYLDTMPIAEFINHVGQLDDGYSGLIFRHPETDHPSSSLETQAYFFGVEIEGAHSALADALACAEVYRKHVRAMLDTFRDSRLLRKLSEEGRIDPLVPENNKAPAETLTDEQKQQQAARLAAVTGEKIDWRTL